ncbi:MAG: bifunctional nuclease domain-containing protein [Candidatus Tectimicrobiota bacterium]
MTVALFGLVTTGWAAKTGPHGPLVAMKVKGVALDPISSKPIAVLETSEGKTRLLPIWIGPFEAHAIAIQMEETQAVRPLTHDLIKNILKGIEAKVQKIVITKLENNIFYAVIRIEINGREVTVDSRPSDAIAVALRVDAPIFATEQVLKAAKTVEESERPELTLAKSALGMTVQALTPDIAEHFNLAESNGVLVSHVQLNSEAASAGVRRGDIITAVGDHLTGSIQAFQEALEAVQGQSRVALQLQRGNARHDLTIKLNTPSE